MGETTSTLIHQIYKWAKEQPYWEQYALDRIINSGTLSSDDYTKMLKYLLDDEGLASTKTEKTPLFQTEQDAEEEPGSIEKPVLISIFNIKNVNALAAGQILEFGDNLTAVYGANGSGKSGYARILGCAGFTRGDQEVLPDISNKKNVDTIISADISIKRRDTIETFTYSPSETCIPLSSFYVFDSTSVTRHLTGKNEFSFSPSGLSYLAELSHAVDVIKDKFEGMVEEKRQSLKIPIAFMGNSPVSEFVMGLTADTRVEDLRSIAGNEVYDKKVMQTLDEEITNLKAHGPIRELTTIKNSLKPMNALLERVQEICSILCDETVNNVDQEIGEYKKNWETAKSLSLKSFEDEHFTQTGTELWRTFINAAIELSKAERDNKKYPGEEDYCLLCHQPLEEEAHALITNIWKYMEGEATEKLNKIKKRLDKRKKDLSSLDLNFFNSELAAYKYLETASPTLLVVLGECIKLCSQRREQLIQAIKKKTIIDETEKMITPHLKIHEHIKEMEMKIEKLNKTSKLELLAEKDKNIVTIRHRQILRYNLSSIEKYLEDIKWLERASHVSINTRHITTFHNELFKKQVTKRYIDLFEKKLKDLKRPLSISITTKPKKGKTLKQITLKYFCGKATKDAPVLKVLSDGEKRAVALADFLTELTLDSGSCGVILDDPVTSLDIEWKEEVARILVEESTNRQVIVFTHDLPFLYFLKEQSKEKTVDIQLHWIKRGDNDDKPGHIFLNNSPGLAKDYRNAHQARKWYKEAKDAPPELQEHYLRQGFAALRTSYEAFIVYDLFNETVMRFQERISFGRLKDIAWDESLVGEVVKKCEQLSRYFEGHLHSEEYAPTPPSVKMLDEEISDFEKMRNRLKELKKK